MTRALDICKASPKCSRSEPGVTRSIFDVVSASARKNRAKRMAYAINHNAAADPFVYVCVLVFNQGGCFY